MFCVLNVLCYVHNFIPCLLRFVYLCIICHLVHYQQQWFSLVYGYCNYCPINLKSIIMFFKVLTIHIMNVNAYNNINRLYFTIIMIIVQTLMQTLAFDCISESLRSCRSKIPINSIILNLAVSTNCKHRKIEFV